MPSNEDRQKWVQLLLGLVCMLVISSPQYVWTLFTQPLMSSLGARLVDLQVTFSILIVVRKIPISDISIFRRHNLNLHSIAARSET